MTTLLVVNPNTSPSVTALLLARAQALAPPGGLARAVTAGFGARYITGELSAAVAGHAALDAYAGDVQSHGALGAVVLGCFGDPGLMALRELAPVPVLGLAEASMRAAQAIGRYAIVTGGAAWEPMLRRLATSLGLAAALDGIVTVERSGAELAADPAAAHELLHAACEEALRRHPRVQAIVLGGAALAGMAASLSPRLPVPLLDSVDVTLHAAWAAAAVATPVGGSPAPGGQWVGLSSPLMQLLAAPRGAVTR
jgi:allantoin racemase